MPTQENEQRRKPTPICTSLITYTHHADVTLPPPSLESKLRSLRIRRMHHINVNISLPANPVQGPSAEERTKITILPRNTTRNPKESRVSAGNYGQLSFAGPSDSNPHSRPLSAKVCN